MLAAAANENATLAFQTQGGREKDYQRGGKLALANTRGPPLADATIDVEAVDLASFLTFHVANRKRPSRGSRGRVVAKRRRGNRTTRQR